ncbi:mala s 12 allergen [Coprinopsis sp. MPI-PUGE-AT-0042]|nr:mala s 12 allergen [Coprinopsis sp. MPI-PUGE-AT-0042]
MLPLLFALSAFTAVPALATVERDFYDVHTHARYALTAREYITPETRLDSYDYIIAGGGLAGLVLASKLSADGTTTVLVLEAGGTGDEQRDIIDRPGLTYWKSILGGEFDYGYATIPQSSAGERNMRWPRGKLLGGSSAVNGMYMVRPNEKEINAIHDLIVTDDNKHYADAWKWDSLLEAMKGSETFTPPIPESLDVAHMRYKAESHGTTGAVHCTFPGYMLPLSSLWLPTLEAGGVSISDDAYSGNNVGGFFTLTAENPSNWTRSYSKSAYIDPLPPRSNLHILTNSMVTRVLFADNIQEGDLSASGVEFARDASNTPKSVFANKEVILSGGAVGSPHMLLVSGVGPRDVLDSLNIPVRVDLPGVGSHVQDHLAVRVQWNTGEETQGDIFRSESDFSKSTEFLSFVNSGTAYVNGSFLFDGQESYQNFLNGLKDTDTTNLVPTESTVAEGYKAIQSTLLEKIYPEVGLVELLYSLNSPSAMIIQAAIQQPLSQGRISINSTSIFDPPVLDPKYFSHPADVVILRQGLKHARRLGSLPPLADILLEETMPGPDVQSDEQIEAWIRENANTEYHPGCSCVMMPREKGGVLDASLKVHGTLNLRVIDSSVFPLSMSAHLMAPTYGLAEKAAELILNPPSPGSSNSPNTNTNTNSTGSQTGDNEPGSATAPLGSTSLLLAIGASLAAIVSNCL